MKIFVTGAAGFMGQETMKLGETLGHTMKGCDLVGKPDLNVVEGSITDLEFLKRETKGFDAIIHTASRHTGDMKAGVSNAEFYAVNVTGSDNVFLSALANGIEPVVFSSSLDIHCGTQWDASGAIKYTEALPDIPTSIYAVTKKMIEDMGHFYARSHGIRFCALRFSSVSNTFQAPQSLRPVPLISRHLVVEDCAMANIQGCESDRVCDDVLLIGPHCPLENADLIEAFKDRDAVIEKHWPGSLELFERAGFNTRGVLWPCCDIRRARQVLGWEPQYGYGWLLEKVKNGLTASD